MKIFILTCLLTLNLFAQNDAESTPTLGQPEKIQIFGRVGSNIKSSSIDLVLGKSLLMPQLSVFNLEGSIGLDRYQSKFSPTIGLGVSTFFLRGGIKYRTHELNNQHWSPYVQFHLAPNRGGLLGSEIGVGYEGGQFVISLRKKLNSKKGHKRARYAHYRVQDKKSIFQLESVLKNYTLESFQEKSLTLMKQMNHLIVPTLEVGDFKKNSKYLKNLNSIIKNKTFSQIKKDYDQLIQKTLIEALGNADLAKKAFAIVKREYLNAIVIRYNHGFGQRKLKRFYSKISSTALKSFNTSITNLLAREDDSLRKHTNLYNFYVTMLRNTGLVLEEMNQRWSDIRLKLYGKIFGLKKRTLNWIPLQFILSPEDYDSQKKIENLVSRFVDHKFEDGNDIKYIYNLGFYKHYKKSILNTQFYHVLWIHDYAGVKQNNPDQVGWDVALNDYPNAILKGVQNHLSDQTKKIPEFHIVLDQHYYEVNKSRKVITFLENLHSIETQDLDNEKEQRISELKSLFNKAISDLKSLNYSEEKIKDLLKVQIHITNKADTTYGAYMIPDSVIRDHRKLYFRDVFKSSPNFGEAVLTGVGIGEHYHNHEWEDRSIKTVGPVNHQIKKELRELLLGQLGSQDESKIPFYFRRSSDKKEVVKGAEPFSKSALSSKSALLTMNTTDYAKKHASIYKMLIFTLAGEGSVVFSPDSLWNSDYWAATFFGAALRGANAFILSPGKSFAPSAATVTMDLQRRVLSVAVTLKQIFRQRIKEAGGSLNIGFYEMNETTDNFSSRTQMTIDGIRKNKDINEFLNIPVELADTIEFFLKSKRLQAGETQDASFHDNPKLHLKTLLYMSKEASVIFKDKFRRHIIQKFLVNRSNSDSISPEYILGTPTNGNSNFINQLESELTPEQLEKVQILFTVGSHNQDRRSKYLDGESMMTVGGWQGITGMIDMIFLIYSSSWIHNIEELEEKMPSGRKGLIQRLNIPLLIKDLI